jgi:ATP-binding cassette subfamily B protein
MEKTSKYKNITSFLWSIIKPFKYHYTIQLVAPIYTGITDLIYFYCVKLFIDTIAKSAFTYEELYYPLVIFFLTPIILNILWRIANILEWQAYPIVRKEILLKSYDYVQHHSYYFFQNNLSGSVLSKVRGILDAYDKLFSATIMKDVLMFGTMLITCTISLFFVNEFIGLFVIIWLIIFFLAMYTMSQKLDTLVYIETESRHNIIGLIADRITNIISLFYFATRKKELALLQKEIINDFIPKQIQTLKYDFKLNFIMWGLYMFMWSGFVFILVYSRKNAYISAGTIAFVFGVVSKISDSVWVLTMKLQDLIRLMGDFRASFEVLTIPHDSQDESDLKELTISKPSIEFKNVAFSYINSPVFANLNLIINPGENVGIVGYSGAGKTTLVNILLKFFAIQHGDILIDGQNLKNLNSDSIRENIAVIPQDILLFHRSLLENIRYGNLNATDLEVIEAAKSAHIHEYIENLPDKYNTLVGERGIKLSGGQRQRIAIARAILKNAPILILDEATSSLDSKTEKDIQDSINYILERKHQTVIAIAHRLSTLRHMDRIIVIDKGKIVEVGTHYELMNKENSLYQKLWQEQKLG